MHLTIHLLLWRIFSGLTVSSLIWHKVVIKRADYNFPEINSPTPKDIEFAVKYEKEAVHIWFKHTCWVIQSWVDSFKPIKYVSSWLSSCDRISLLSSICKIHLTFLHRKTNKQIQWVFFNQKNEISSCTTLAIFMNLF